MQSRRGLSTRTVGGKLRRDAVDSLNTRVCLLMPSGCLENQIKVNFEMPTWRYMVESEQNPSLSGPFQALKKESTIGN